MKKPAYKKRTTRKTAKKYARRRMYKRNPLTAPLDKRVYSYRERIKYTDVTVNAAASVTAVYQPSLSNINTFVPAGPNTGELLAYQNLYDQYMIWKFVVEYKPKQPMIDQTVPVFDIYTVIDYNDVNTIPTVAAALEYATCRRHSSNKGFKRSVYPRIPILTSDINGTALLEAIKPRYLPTGAQPYLQTPHLGLKVITGTNNAAINIGYEVFLTLYLKFKSKL